MKGFQRVGVSIVFAASIVFAVTPVYGVATIDFEGFTRHAPLGSVTTGGNVVTFSVGTPGAAPGVLAEVGGPMSAYVPLDTPAGENAGLMFLTDERFGPDLALDYFIEFAAPVTFLSLDLYDYRVDGGPEFGDTATLTAYSDLFNTAVATDVFAIPFPNPIDGNVETLSVAAESILSVSLIFDAPDIGTGIDNVTFSTPASPPPVPAPGALLLGGIGAGIIGCLRRRRAF